MTKSLRAAAAALQDPPDRTSIRQVAGTVAAPFPVSVSRLIDTLMAPLVFHADITTPSGTALGGQVDLTISSDGRFSFTVHMHDSGYDPYTFKVRCALQVAGGLTVLFQTSGHTEGTGSNLFGSPVRNFDHHEDGHHSMIRQFWTDVRFSTLAVSKSYEDVGVVRELEDLAKDLLGFLIADVTVGVGLALVICASADLTDAFNGSFVGPGGLVGVVVAGAIAWVWGPSAIIASVVGGLVAGAITDAAIKHRNMTQAEHDFANIVFGGTIPPRDRMYITNLTRKTNRKYTWPELDGSVVLNLGEEPFDDPIHFSGGNYVTRGQLFIHEMTHAWQIQAKTFIPGVACKYISETHSYKVGEFGRPWSDYGIEQQAAMVDQWFGGFGFGWKDTNDLIKKLNSPPALEDIAFPYIQNNIRLGQN